MNETTEFTLEDFFDEVKERSQKVAHDPEILRALEDFNFELVSALNSLRKENDIEPDDLSPGALYASETDKDQQRRILLRLLPLVLQGKATDYGDSWRADGLFGAILNLKRKTDRLAMVCQNLRLKGEEQTIKEMENNAGVEALHDTIFDILGYGILIHGLLAELAPLSSANSMDNLVEYMMAKLKKEG